MLTQSQINKAVRLLRRNAHLYSASELDRRISQKIGCSEATISSLRRGLRNHVGKPEYKLPRKQVTVQCDKHGEVPGTYCPFCSVHDGVSGIRRRTVSSRRRETTNRRVDDPTPEEIAERAAEIRSQRERSRLEDPDAGELLWIPESVLSQETICN